jgi:PPK2 family polyphosphate:nucleotide phosphotransferase
MKRKQVIEKLDSLIKPYKITSGKTFSLADVDPGDTLGLVYERKDEAAALLKQGIEVLAELQDRLYADDRWGVLLIFQAMDAAGKDSTIKQVMSGINPQGCQVYSFKQPSAEELDHDYMWRYVRCLPERGRIGIFNRSYYEEVLVVRVHDEILQAQKIPKQLITKEIWRERLEDIRNFERYLSRNGIVVLKFFLHVSRKEQEKRFLARLTRPDKHWKFSMADIHDREHWETYMGAYEETIRSTATKEAPWFVVPADNKWFTRLVVANAVAKCLEGLDVNYPSVSKQMKEEIEQARQMIEGKQSSTQKSRAGRLSV